MTPEDAEYNRRAWRRNFIELFLIVALLLFCWWIS